MRTQNSFHEFEITFPAYRASPLRRGKICAELWRAIAPETRFDPHDERVRDLDWAHGFACLGLSCVRPHPEGLVFRVAFDVPTGSKQFRVLARRTRDRQWVLFSLFGRGAGEG